MSLLLSENSTTAKSTVFVHSDKLIGIGIEEIAMLKTAAAQDLLGRARICLHRSHDDNVQEMVIAFTRNSYIRPHKHKNKSESFHIIEGTLLVVFFDDSGSVVKSISMGPPGSGRSFLLRSVDSPWHTVVPFSDLVVIHETTTGPFSPDDNEFAPWSPLECHSEKAEQFLTNIFRTISGLKD